MYTSMGGNAPRPYLFVHRVDPLDQLPHPFELDPVPPEPTVFGIEVHFAPRNFVPTSKISLPAVAGLGRLGRSVGGGGSGCAAAHVGLEKTRDRGELTPVRRAARIREPRLEIRTIDQFHVHHETDVVDLRKGGNGSSRCCVSNFFYPLIITDLHKERRVSTKTTSSKTAPKCSSLPALPQTLRV